MRFSTRDSTLAGCNPVRPLCAVSFAAYWHRFNQREQRQRQIDKRVAVRLKGRSAHHLQQLQAHQTGGGCRGGRNGRYDASGNQLALQRVDARHLVVVRAQVGHAVDEVHVKVGGVVFLKLPSAVRVRVASERLTSCGSTLTPSRSLAVGSAANLRSRAASSLSSAGGASSGSFSSTFRRTLSRGCHAGTSTFDTSTRNCTSTQSVSLDATTHVVHVATCFRLDRHAHGGGAQIGGRQHKANVQVVLRIEIDLAQCGVSAFAGWRGVVPVAESVSVATKRANRSW